MVSPAAAVAATRSASDSVFRCRKEEWFRLQNATTPRLQRFLISRPNLGIAARKPSRTAKLLHRFLISRPNLGIDACFSPFMPSCVHRFLNSIPNLGIDASFSPFKPSCVHRFLISRPNLRIDAAQSSWRWRIARLQHRRVDAGRDRMPRRRHNPKKKAAGVAPVPAATTARLRF